MASSADQDTRTAAVRQFANELKRVKREAGEPSLREINRRSGNTLTIATTSRMLNGKAVPSWFFTQQFLSACEIDTDTIKTFWRPKWVQMTDVLHPLNSQPLVAATGQPDASPGMTCPECGLIMGDPELHRGWHETQNPPTPRPTALHAVSEHQDGKPWIRRRKAS